MKKPQKAKERPLQEALEDAQILALSPEDQRRFAEAMLNPPEVGPTWKKARKAYRKLIRKSE